MSGKGKKKRASVPVTPSASPESTQATQSASATVAAPKYSAVTSTAQAAAAAASPPPPKLSLPTATPSSSLPAAPESVSSPASLSTATSTTDGSSPASSIPPVAASLAAAADTRAAEQQPTHVPADEQQHEGASSSDTGGSRSGGGQKRAADDQQEPGASDAQAAAQSGRKLRKTQEPPLRPPAPAVGTRACIVPMRAGRDSLQKLYETGGGESFHDVVLRVGDVLRLPAHRVILAAHSPFFARMFSVSMAEQHGGDVTLEDIDHEALAAVVSSFYSSGGTIALSAANVGAIIRCASRLQTASIEKVAVNYFCSCLEPECASAALCFATEMAATGSGPTKELLRQCLSYVSEHFRLCAQQPRFLLLPHETVRSLLASDYLECDEIKVFFALMSWIKHQEATRTPLMAELLPLIRFPQMLPSDLKAVCAEPLLTQLPGGLLMPLLAECVPGAGDLSCTRLRPRSGSAKKIFRFSHVRTAAYGMGSGLSLLDQGAIVSTVEGCDGGTAWCDEVLQEGRHFAEFFVIRGGVNLGVLRPLWRLAMIDNSSGSEDEDNDTDRQRHGQTVGGEAEDMFEGEEGRGSMTGTTPCQPYMPTPLCLSASVLR